MYTSYQDNEKFAKSKMWFTREHCADNSVHTKQLPYFYVLCMFCLLKLLCNEDTD